MTHKSIADIHEHEFIERLIGDPLDREALLGIRGLPDDPLIFTQVLLNDAPLPAKRRRWSGEDVDIFLHARNRPDEATAIQVKRIKVSAKAFRNQSPNKLPGFKKGVEQANLLADIGFFQVYLFVLVAVDSREHNRGEVSYDGPTNELRRVIETTIRPDKLLDRVGLLHLEYVQPMDYSPLSVGAGGSDLRQSATAVPQAAELTEWVAGVSSKYRSWST